MPRFFVSMARVRIIGAGLAGSEAAWQVASRGHAVELFEMRPQVMTKAHHTASCAELVCSNSFRGASLSNAVGLLKEELRLAHSLILQSADRSAVPAGGALAVDREVFSGEVDRAVRTHPLVRFRVGEVTKIPDATSDDPVIVATGPLTSKPLAKAIEALVGSSSLAFFDAISPIIFGESLDLTKVFRQSRYDKGDGDDYLNIPLSREEYYAFVDAVQKGEKYGGHEEVESDMVADLRPFEGCMPIEEMVERGPNTLLFGPFKPVGLTDPRTGKRPYAVAQLRQDNREGTLWSMVGMQTRLKHPEQLRIFRTLPGLEDAEFVRLGSVHRNTFIDSPRCLEGTLELRSRPGLFFAGQMTGVEGYVESTAGGLVAGINAARLLEGKKPLTFPKDTAIGSLIAYISDRERKNFQPMNISFGLMPSYFEEPEDAKMAGGKKRKTSRADRRSTTAERALGSLERFLTTAGLPANVIRSVQPTVTTTG